MSQPKRQMLTVVGQSGVTSRWKGRFLHWDHGPKIAQETFLFRDHAETGAKQTGAFEHAGIATLHD
jgi:hypothetical protein